MSIDTHKQNDQPVTGRSDIVSRCSTLNLRRASRAASHILDHYLAPIDLRVAQFGVLSAISKLSSTTMTGLADYMVMDRTTLTRNLAVLERDGMVATTPGADKRVREIRLTDLGQARLAEARPLWAEGENAIRQQLGTERWELLLSLLVEVAALEIPDGAKDGE